jgi:ppGpp synthetase/RelA/SpoT-type nucleotidyltranferase
MEEVWGEVDHAINYPHEHESLACREQIRALARSTSSATRLVDAIFATVADFEIQKTSVGKSVRRRRPKKSKEGQGDR